MLLITEQQVSRVLLASFQSPVYNSLTKDRKQVAFLSAFFRWGIFFDDVLPSDQRGIWVVLHSTCGPDYTYEIFGHKAVYMGIGDKHEREVRS